MHANSLFGAVARAMRIIAGMPDYDSYLASRARTNDGTVLLSRAEFDRDRLERRYDSKGGNRCC